MNITSLLYKMARASASLKATRSKRGAAVRVKNVTLGRMFARAGIWRMLFGGGRR